MMCCNPKFCRGPNLSFFRLGPTITPFELFFSKLSETLKNLTLDPRNSSLWQPKEWCVAIQNFVGGLICHFSALDHGLLFMVSPHWQILSSLKSDFWWHHLNYFFSKLSENPKKFDIGSTEFKLWQLKESPINGM